MCYDHKALFEARNRRANTRMTLNAKNGVWLMRKRNCFSEIGASVTSVTAMAAAVRVNECHFAENAVGIESV